MSGNTPPMKMLLPLVPAGIGAERRMVLRAKPAASFAQQQAGRADAEAGFTRLRRDTRLCEHDVYSLVGSCFWHTFAVIKNMRRTHCKSARSLAIRSIILLL